VLQSDKKERLCNANAPDIIGSSYSPGQEDITNSQSSNLLISYETSCFKDTESYSAATVSSLSQTNEAASPLRMKGPQTSCRKRKPSSIQEVLIGTPMKGLGKQNSKEKFRAQKKR
jgi:hypothetical protein